VTSPEGYLLGLWVHECRRVFADKLVSHEDKSWVDKAISDLCRQEFPPELCKQVCGRASCGRMGPGKQQGLPAFERFIMLLHSAATRLPCFCCCCCCRQVDEPLYFVDFLREPVVDEETGEVIEAHPSNYEAVPGGLPEIRSFVEALQRRFNEESKVRQRCTPWRTAQLPSAQLSGAAACCSVSWSSYKMGGLGCVLEPGKP
jgi:dynein heavy chain